MTNDSNAYKAFHGAVEAAADALGFEPVWVEETEATFLADDGVTILLGVDVDVCDEDDDFEVFVWCPAGTARTDVASTSAKSLEDARTLATFAGTACSR